MVSQIYFLKCLQISSTQIKHTYNYSAAVNKLLVIWNSIFYLTHTQKKKERNGKKRRKVKEKKEVSSGSLWLHDKIQSQSFRMQPGVPWFQHAECLKRGLSEHGSCEGLTHWGVGSQAGLTRGGGSPPAFQWGAAATLTGPHTARSSSICSNALWVTFLHAGQYAGSGLSSSRCHKRGLTNSAVPCSLAPLSSQSDQLSRFSAA